nr:MAG TPA: hypothetical protein [Caudoviricetes sp.]
MLCAIVPCAVPYFKSLKALWDMALCHSSINFSDFSLREKKIYRFSKYDTVYI